MTPYILGFLAVVVALLVLQSVVKSRRHEVFAYDWDHTALFVDGQFDRWLQPGRHVVRGREVKAERVDRRRRAISVPMQEILTADGASVRVSLSASYRVSDPAKHLLEHAEAYAEFYNGLQLALRSAVGERTLEAVASGRMELSAATTALAAAGAAEVGIEIERLEIRDFAVLGEMRKAVAGVLQARLEGQAALERARSETAALRSLANAARMMEENPNLLNLRLLQTVEGNRNASVVFDPRATPAKPPIAPE